MLSSGVSRETITDLVRVVQYETLYHVALLLEGAIEPSLPIRAFSAFEVDADGSPVTLVQGVHEVLLSLDPTRREMRPRNAGGGPGRRCGLRAVDAARGGVGTGQP